MARPEASEATGACLVRQRLTRWEHFSARQYGFLSRLPHYTRVCGSIGQGLSGFDGTARALKRKVLVVGLHYRENERGANTEQ